MLQQKNVVAQDITSYEEPEPALNGGDGSWCLISYLERDLKVSGFPKILNQHFFQTQIFFYKKKILLQLFFKFQIYFPREISEQNVSGKKLFRTKKC